jgi:ABC-2 type transport system permease protein
MNRPFFTLLGAQFKEYFREPEAIFWSFFFPILLSWALGIAFSTKSDPVRTVAVVAHAGGRIADLQLLDRQGIWVKGVDDRSGPVPPAIPPELRSFRFFSCTPEVALAALKKGRIDIYLEAREDSPLLEFHFDPQNAEGRLTGLLLQRALRSGRGEPPSGRDVPLTIQGTRYIDFLVPGLLALNIMSACLWGVAWGMIELRMKKLLKRITATPLDKNVLLLSFLVSRLVLSVVEFILMFGFARLIFGVRITGSLPAMLLVFLMGNFAFFGIAILVGSRTDNTRVGNGLINVVNMPMLLLSGIFFSYHHFPAFIIPVVRLLPLTLVADTLRAVTNEGAGMAEVALPCLQLGILGVILFWVGRRVFKWY